MDPDFRRVRAPAKSVTVDPEPSQTETPATETFQAPETEANDTAPSEPTVERAPLNFEPPAEFKRKETLRSRIADKFHAHKREWLASTAIVLVCGSLVGFVLIKTDKKPSVAAEKPIVKTKEIAPKIVPSMLSGLPVDPAVNQRTVTGIMIENSPHARPQSGLSEAGVVFEAIAEYGITRFLALYQDKESENIGPVRSARPYFVQWAMGFDAGYAHVGGSPAALQSIREWGARDLDQFHNSGAYRRIPSRQAPHNVYTSMTALNNLETSKGYTSSTFTGFERKKEAAAKLPTAKTVNLAISGPMYNVRYDYNPPTNSYNRVNGGSPHVDANTNTQLSPKVVVALVIPYGLEANGYHSKYATIGSGSMFVFQDGLVTNGTWTKADNKSQFTFTDAAGKPLKLNPGQTWITAVKADANVTFSP